jgi:tetratricopeptide (TPR) repeat protein
MIPQEIPNHPIPCIFPACPSFPVGRPLRAGLPGCCVELLGKGSHAGGNYHNHLLATLKGDAQPTEQLHLIRSLFACLSKKQAFRHLLYNHIKRSNVYQHQVIMQSSFRLLVWSVCLVAPACNGIPRPVAFHDPLTPQEHVALGETYKKQGDREGAARAFKAAIKRDPHDVPALIALGSLAFQKGAWEEAELYYRRALELSPDNPVAANNLAMIYLSKGERLDETERLARLALKQDTNLRPYIQETLATLYMRQGRLEEARRAVDEAETTLRPEHIALQERLQELRHEIISKQLLMPAPP